MSDLSAFCAEFGIDETAAAKALERPDGESASPWYVRAFLALGAWVTAIAIVAFFAVFIGLVLDSGDGFEAVLTVLGMACFATGLGMLARQAGGEFRKSFATALAAAGAAMSIAGVAFVTEDIWVSVFASLVLAGFVIAWAPGVILQLLVSGLAAGLIAAALVYDQVPYFLDFAALLLVAGVLLWVRPPQVEMRPTAFALLLAEPALSIFVRFGYWSDVPPGGWVALAVHAALFIWLISILWRHTGIRADRMKLGVFAVAAVAVAVLLPPGGSDALVILTLAFVVGSKPLGLLGALLQAHFLLQFYYDLAISLLNKSLLLTAVGLVVLVCWWLIAGRRPARAGA